MSIESWKTFFDVGALILLFLTFAFGAGILITGNVINRGQEVRLRQFEKDRQDSDLKLAEVQRDAKNADVRIAEADARAKGAEAQVAAAMAASDDAVAKVALADARSAEASAKAEGFRLDIAKANESAERERLARLKIEEKLAPRLLTYNEVNGVFQKMQPLGVQKIDFFLYPNDGEIMAIAQQVASSLQGWTVKAVQPLGGGTVSGMLVEYDPSDASATSRAATLVAALKDCGLTVKGPLPTLPTPQDKLPAFLGNGPIDASIRLTVGRK